MDEDRLCINTLRFLSVDMVEKARSGHPGLPLGAAPMLYVLWTKFLRHNPKNPAWADRDRFVLSAGHGSALLYALLHLSGYEVGMDELKNFRQWGSKTAGHPEYGAIEGIEATTGPLGQGFAMGVGMAVAEKFLAGTFNRPGMEIINHKIYALVSDGDLMEGVASEAASLAGTLKLDNLIYLYDDNKVSLEGSTELAFTEDVAGRFRALGWRVLNVNDGNDVVAIEKTLSEAVGNCGKPTLIVVKTHIGYGSPKQDTKDAHGEPLGTEGVIYTKKNLGWPTEPNFIVPEQAKKVFAALRERGRNLEDKNVELYARYKSAYPQLSAAYEDALSARLPAGWDEHLPVFNPKDGAIATRDASSKALNAIAEKVPTLIGGSADLAPSTKTLLKDGKDFVLSSAAGRNIHYGVREHAMAGLMNGMALHGGVVPYGATFLIFSDYAKPSIRLSALMGVHNIFLFTHDSIALGEDGPTHQPIEQLWGLRAIPGFKVIRPADANETVSVWKISMLSHGPVAIVLTRQKVPVLDVKHEVIDEGVKRGGYIVVEPDDVPPNIILIATGSEVHIAIDAAKKLLVHGIRARVVSMPCLEIFDSQDREYRDSVIPPKIPKLAIEAGSPIGWWKYVGESGRVIGLTRFGSSAPGNIVMEKLGFSADNIIKHALEMLKS